MAELADALDSGSNGRKVVQVQVLSPAPNKINPNFVIKCDGFGFSVMFTCFYFNKKVIKQMGAAEI